MIQVQFQGIKDNSLDTFKKPTTHVIVYRRSSSRASLISLIVDRGAWRPTSRGRHRRTFTDCVVIDPAGVVTTAKSPSTPDDFARGMLDAHGRGGGRARTDLDGLCRQTELLSHGTTIGTNAIVQQRGAPVGLITTRGHNDVIHIMRGSRGITGRDIQQVVHFPESSKPDPIVPKRLIEGSRNASTASARSSCRSTKTKPSWRSAGWSPRASRRSRSAFSGRSASRPRAPGQAMVQQIAPDLFVTCSADLVPKWGEYERVTAVALNGLHWAADLGLSAHLDGQLRARGYKAAAADHPVRRRHDLGREGDRRAALDAMRLGPVAGVRLAYLGDLMGLPQHHHHRHGRHVVRRRPHLRR